VCVLCGFNFATVADHYPLTRKELVERGMDPNNPDAGRGLCKPCHDRYTAISSPGGWNA
jgi:5-methylcytosine-specific restriction protein A